MQRLTKSPWGIFWDILKLLDAQSHLPAGITAQQSWQKCVLMKTPPAAPSATAQSPLLGISECQLQEQQPWGSGMCSLPLYHSSPGRKELAWGNRGDFKSAQQPSAHVGQHIFIIVSRGQGQLEEQELSWGAGKGNHLEGFPARFRRRPVWKSLETFGKMCVTAFLGISSGPQILRGSKEGHNDYYGAERIVHIQMWLANTQPFWPFLSN